MNMVSMSGIGGVSMSPRTMMDNRIDAAVKSGSISATDETALETALDSIDSALGVGSSGSSIASSATGKLDPAKMKERIDDLIDQQVKSGTLTEDQAATLQSLFAQGGPKSGSESGSEDTDSLAMGGVEGAGRARPMGPPPPPPPSGTDSDSDEDSSTSDTDATKQIDTLIAFLTAMRETMTSKNVYSTGSSVSTTADSSNSGLIVDTLA